MILLNVAQELADVSEILKHSAFEELQQDCIAYMKDIMENFYQPDHMIVELFTEDPFKKDTLLFRHRNPGHAIESMWFVMETAHKTGYSDYIQKAEMAVEKAVEIGWDGDFGGLYRFVDSESEKPKGKKIHSPYEKMITETWDMKLWWPHSEALYATLLAFTLTGNGKMLDLHKKIQNYVFNIFPNPEKKTGEWIQIRDREGNPQDQVVALPVKDPFHILRSLLRIRDLLEKQSQTENSQN